MSDENNLVLEVRHVSGGYRESGLFAGKQRYHKVLHDVDFVVRHGEILGIWETVICTKYERSTKIAWK